jgi:hypothetical protein
MDDIIQGKKTLAEINNPSPFAHVSLSRKGMPGPKGGLISISDQKGQIHTCALGMGFKLVVVVWGRRSENYM